MAAVRGIGAELPEWVRMAVSCEVVTATVILIGLGDDARAATSADARHDAFSRCARRGRNVVSLGISDYGDWAAASETRATRRCNHHAHCASVLSALFWGIWTGYDHLYDGVLVLFENLDPARDQNLASSYLPGFLLQFTVNSTNTKEKKFPQCAKCGKDIAVTRKKATWYTAGLPNLFEVPARADGPHLANPGFHLWSFWTYHLDASMSFAF